MEIQVEPPQLQFAEQNLEQMTRRLRQMLEETECVMTELQHQTALTESLQLLHRWQRRLTEQQRQLNMLTQTLMTICRTYESTEYYLIQRLGR